MAPKSDVSEERRHQILEAAKLVFSKHGIHKTRMSDIAESSGLSKGALYWYFDSKDAIILSLLDKVFEPEIQELEALLDDPHSAEERLMLYAERGGQDIIDMLKWMPLIYDFFALAFRQPAIKESITRYYRRNLSLLETLIRQGIESSEFKTDSPLDAAITIGSIIEGTVMLWLYDPESIDIIQHIKSNTRLLLDGLRA
jgi:TetR/AcrR family fatty acid metabolism transcriptional regulator